MASSDPVTDRIRTLQGDKGPPGGWKKGKKKLQVTREESIPRVEQVRPPDVPQVRPRLGLLRMEIRKTEEAREEMAPRDLMVRQDGLGHDRVEGLISR